MLSRAESLGQLVILDKLYDQKWKVSRDALGEVERMEREALNSVNNFKHGSLNILSFNIRSLPANYVNLLKEPYIYDYDFILLQETWVKQNEFNCYEIDGFKSQFTGGAIGKAMDWPITSKIIFTYNKAYMLKNFKYVNYLVKHWKLIF